MDDIPFINRVGYLSPADKFESFQLPYLETRVMEFRLFSDEQLKSLPVLLPSHPLYIEWLKRAQTMNRFVKYLAKYPPLGPVLDLGCGNGWFSHVLKENIPYPVFGLDVNKLELEQAARVFMEEDLYFFFGDIFENIFPGRSFAMIVLNASAQYFPDLTALLKILLSLLDEGGEIHFLDTHFYKDDLAAAEAAKRSGDYYSTLGFPEMASHYYHHQLNTLNEIHQTRIDILFDPLTFISKVKKVFRGPSSPFPWIRIMKD